MTASPTNDVLAAIFETTAAGRTAFQVARTYPTAPPRQREASRTTAVLKDTINRSNVLPPDEAVRRPVAAKAQGRSFGLEPKSIVLSCI